MPKIVNVEAIKLEVCEAAIDGLSGLEVPFTLRNLARSMDRTKGFLQHYFNSMGAIKSDTLTLLLKRQSIRLAESQSAVNSSNSIISGLITYLPITKQQIKEHQALNILTAYYPKRCAEDRKNRLNQGATLIRDSKCCATYVDNKFTAARCLRAYDLLLINVEGLSRLSQTDGKTYTKKKCKDRVEELMNSMH